MVSRNERDVLIDHALRDEENLEVSLKIGAAYDELRGRVIVRFLEEVRRDLADRLGETWKIAVCQDTNQLTEKWLELLLAEYLGHTGQFRIVLGGDEPGYPKWVWMGVRAANAPELHVAIKQAIDQDYVEGKVGDPSFWYRYLDKAYATWGSEDATLLLYRKSEVADYLVGNLERLARVIEESLKQVEY